MHSRPKQNALSTITPLLCGTTAMSDSESDDNLRPHKLGRREFEPSYFSGSNDEPEVRDYNSDTCSAATCTCNSPPYGISDDIDDSIAYLTDAAIN